MDRHAVNSIGCIGSLYDGCRDRVIEQRKMSVRGHGVSVSGSARCRLIRGIADRSFNVLQIIGVKDELRVSLLLQLAQRSGIAAVLNHPRDIDRNTRFLHYSYTCRKEELQVKQLRNSEITGEHNLQINVTHVITGVTSGIDLLVVLQLPLEGEIVNRIDLVLQKIVDLLSKDKTNILILTSEEDDLLDKLLDIRVYSNTESLSRLFKVSDIYNQINIIKRNTYHCPPVVYVLQPVASFYTVNTRQVFTHRSLPSKLRGDIELYILRVRNSLKRSKILLNENIGKLLCGCLQHQLNAAQIQRFVMIERFQTKMQRFCTLVVEIRRGSKHAVEDLNHILQDNEAVSLKNDVDMLSEDVNALEEKGQLITSLRQQQIEYLDYQESYLNKCKDLGTIEQMLIRSGSCNQALCTNDTLNKSYPSKFVQLRQLLVKNRENNPSVRLNYIDFSYSAFALQNIVILPLLRTAHYETPLKQQDRVPKITSQISIKPSLSLMLTLKKNNCCDTCHEQQSTIPVDTLKTSSTSLLTSTRRVDHHDDHTELQATILTNTPQISPTSSLSLISTSKTTNHRESHQGQQATSPLHESKISPTSLPPPISTLKTTDCHQDHQEQLGASSINTPQSSPAPSSPTPPAHEVINVLLLGETGVGKSTFINALANYLTFDSFEQAETNEPVVLIPVSFLVTVGDNFDERIVKFGEFDSSNNEDFEHSGQSVTQHCKSYIFDLKHNSRKQLCIIDTPGFGDTRGLAQDDQNMEHILHYIDNLTHLNAICFLLKPNASRLHTIFRACFTQLFSFLQPNARKNLIFCFTNARSTFYTPGDTAPLLKTMFKSLSITDIPFDKNNTFCFDNESFRFLAALQNDILFDDENKREYKMSWSKSVTESNRLIDYIDKDLNVCQIKNERRSTKQAQFEISNITRPILEAMRNILRNLILREMGNSRESIELSSKSLHHTATRCLSCKPNPLQVGQFCITPTLPHEIRGDCVTCSCTLDQHVPMDYAIEYRCWHNGSDLPKNHLNDTVDILREASAKFTHFLRQTTHSNKDDSFLTGLVKMIEDERYICDTQKRNDFNSQLVTELTKLKDKYEHRTNQLGRNQEITDLDAVEDLIKIIGEIPVVHEQMDAIKRTQQTMMKEYEYEVQQI